MMSPTYNDHEPSSTTLCGAMLRLRHAQLYPKAFCRSIAVAGSRCWHNFGHDAIDWGNIRVKWKVLYLGLNLGYIGIILGTGCMQSMSAGEQGLRQQRHVFAPSPSIRFNLDNLLPTQVFAMVVVRRTQG